MKALKIVLGVLAAAAVIAAIASQFDWSGGRGGGANPAIERINSESDCTTLQAEFDTAERNRHTDYMQAADRRMRQVGCY